MRERKAILVPTGGDFSVGSFELDAWEKLEGDQGLMIALTQEQCRDVLRGLL